MLCCVENGLEMCVLGHNVNFMFYMFETSNLLGRIAVLRM